MSMYEGRNDWVRKSMHNVTEGQYDMVMARQLLNEERAKLLARLSEIDEQLAKVDAAEEVNRRL